MKLKLVAKPDETEGDFKARVQLAAREQRDAEVEKLRAQVRAEVADALDQQRRAEQNVEKQKAQVKDQSMSTVLVDRSDDSRRDLRPQALQRDERESRRVEHRVSASKVSSEQSDVAAAEAELAAIGRRSSTSTRRCRKRRRHCRSISTAPPMEIEPVAIQPRKTDITVGRVTLCWLPWSVDDAGLPVKGVVTGHARIAIRVEADLIFPPKPPECEFCLAQRASMG